MVFENTKKHVMTVYREMEKDAPQIVSPFSPLGIALEEPLWFMILVQQSAAMEFWFLLTKVVMTGTKFLLMDAVTPSAQYPTVGIVLLWIKPAPQIVVMG